MPQAQSESRFKFRTRERGAGQAPKFFRICFRTTFEWCTTSQQEMRYTNMMEAAYYTISQDEWILRIKKILDCFQKTGFEAEASVR